MCGWEARENCFSHLISEGLLNLIGQVPLGKKVDRTWQHFYEPTLVGELCKQILLYGDR